jgi:hypothetical protein
MGSCVAGETLVMLLGNVWTNLNGSIRSLFSVLKGNKVGLTILPHFL